MSIIASLFRSGRLRKFVFTTLRAGTVLICLLVAADRTVVGDEVTEKEDHFEKSVRPLLVQKCYKCHSGWAHRLTDVHGNVVKEIVDT